MPPHCPSRAFVHSVGDCSLQKAKGQKKGKVGCSNTLHPRRSISNQKNCWKYDRERKSTYLAGMLVLHTYICVYIYIYIYYVCISCNILWKWICSVSNRLRWNNSDRSLLLLRMGLLDCASFLTSRPTFIFLLNAFSVSKIACPKSACLIPNLFLFLLFLILFTLMTVLNHS